MQKPTLSFWQIWNMCFGFVGIQFGFALQNANVSRIFQTLGAEIEHIPLLWIAAPLTGLIVQPIVGHFSDRTWTRFGRRRPYFFYGAIVTSVALIFMPHSSNLWIAAGLLWILDASINVTMEPFRAFVGDNLPSKQRTLGYAMQSFFIGLGAIVASMLPWILHHGFGVETTAEAGNIPDSVRFAFYAGALILLVSVMWTVFRSSEYSPEELEAFDDEAKLDGKDPSHNTPVFSFSYSLIWIGLGVVATAAIALFKLEAQLYLLSAGLLAFGLMQSVAVIQAQNNKTNNSFYEICVNLATMPETMKRLAWVQFFSWFALFAMWIYTTPAVTSFHYGTTDPQSALFNEGANWVGVLFGAYNGFAMLAAICIPTLSRAIGNKRCHQLNLAIGAISLASFLFIKDPHWLILPMVGVGFAWCSILSIPYAILADSISAKNMGVFMGIFNFFIVIPQLLAATVLGLVIKYIFNGEPIYALVVGAMCWCLAIVASERVREQN